MVERPHLVPAGPDPDAADIRVVAVREVLAGDGVGDVARRHEVDVAVLHRWVTAFVDAGAAQVTNRPDAGSARQRDRFLAAFAHETRAPLAAARGWVDLLREGDLPDDRVAPTVARLDDALARLEDRARDVELLASASLGLLRLHPAHVPVSELTAGYGPDLAGDDTVLHVDRELMGRVLGDLWAAARLPPSPEAVALAARRTGPWTELRVVRRGRPLDPATLRTLFEPFDVDDDGSGITIGLYLARALAVAHGGAVGVDQDEESTTFWVRVPGGPESEEIP